MFIKCFRVRSRTHLETVPFKPAIGTQNEKRVTSYTNDSV